MSTIRAEFEQYKTDEWCKKLEPDSDKHCQLRIGHPGFHIRWLYGEQFYSWNQSGKEHYYHDGDSTTPVGEPVSFDF